MNLELFITSLLGLGSLLVAFLLYLHSKRSQRDAWLKAYAEIYQAFWNDDEMREIRSWIANEDAFLDAKKVMKKRASLDLNCDGIKFTKEEYLYIDKIDRFLSLMTRMVATGNEFKAGDEFWGAGLWQFWLKAFYARSELRWYVERYWKELAEYCKNEYGIHADSPIVWQAKSKTNSQETTNDE